MTWVISVPALGTGLLLGDIAVTMGADGAVAPYGARKVHPLGTRAAVGFAGSVLIAMTLLEDLQTFSAQQNEWELLDAMPEWVASVARTYESRFPEKARALGLELMIMAAQDSRADTGGTVGFGTVRGRVLTFPRSVGQRAQAIELLHAKAASIGYGSGPYAARLESSIGKGLIQSFENLSTNRAPHADLLYGKMVALRITEALHEDPLRGISEQLFICIVGGPALVVIDNQLPPGADGRPQPGAPAPFPDVAHTLQDLERLEGETGVSATALLA